MTISSSLLSISFRSGEERVRLTNPSDWERAVRAGEISRDSMVVVEHGAVTEAVDACAIGELAPYFQALKLAPADPAGYGGRALN